MKLGSLFDGIGGFPLAAQRHGITPVWASEIEKWPIKVTKKHFPNMKHLGDIAEIDGAEIKAVNIITFGSPCQGLSVAGKREGLQDERSGLFIHAVRIIREMRKASGGRYPRFAVWENVPGAFSSNKRQDFRAVLEEITETEIPMPASGKWATAGMVRTERVDVAWRVLDAQYWGVPQRRRRIFLVADFGGQCAGEILFKPEGLPGDSQEGQEKRQEAAATVGNGATESSRINSTPEGVSGAVSSKWAKGTGGPAGDECYNLIIEPQLYDMTHADEVRDLGDKSGALAAQPGMKQQTFIYGICSDSSNSMKSSNPHRGNPACNQGGMAIVQHYAVRRLTPLECLRLQGFPDWWLDIEGMSDTQKYKAIGNSLAIPCVEFIMKGLAEVGGEVFEHTKIKSQNQI